MLKFKKTYLAYKKINRIIMILAMNHSMNFAICNKWDLRILQKIRLYKFK